MLSLLIVLAVMLMLIIFGWGLFFLLVQLGVIVNQAAKPPHSDTGDYHLSQGRDIGKDHKG